MSSTRRHNAPVRPHRPPTMVPGLLVALGVAGWAMAGAFLLASFGDNNVTASEAGRDLARLFAAALAISGTFTFLLGLWLFRGERGQRGKYAVPVVVGLTIGVLEAVLFLEAAGALLLAPFALLLLVLHPVRQLISRLVRLPREYSR